MNKDNLPLHLPDAGPVADKLIAVHFFGWAWKEIYCPVCGFWYKAGQCEPGNCSMRPIPNPTARTRSILPYTHCDKTALQLIARLRDNGWLVSLDFAPDGVPFLMGNDALNDPESHARVKCELTWSGDILGFDGDFRNPQFGLADDMCLAVARAAWKTVSMRPGADLGEGAHPAGEVG